MRRHCIQALRLWLGALMMTGVLGFSAGSATADDAAASAAVFDHHLGAFAQGIDAILADYTEDSVVFTPSATYRGLKDIRAFFQAFLDGATPEFWQAFKVEQKQVDGAIAYLVWSSMPSVPKATDTLFIREGKIAVQTFTPFGG